METANLTAEPDWCERRTAPIRIGASSVDLDSGAVHSPNGTHHLGRKELQLLAFLYQNNGVIFSRDELLRRVWNYQGVLLTRTVDQTVATLRRKLNDNTARPRHLITVHGIGYRLKPDCA